jgi:uncharacterized membrane protein
MTVPSWVRKLALAFHVMTSVGWVGAVGVFLAIAAIGLTTPDAQTARGAYLVMDRAAWLVLLPLSLASLASGVLQSLVTPWGLFRHYWVLAKLLINLFAVTVLLMYMDTFRAMAAVAASPERGLSAVQNPSPLLHAVLALALLVVALVLAIYKPRGLTRYGWRKKNSHPHGGGQPDESHRTERNPGPVAGL